jgi:hypothetical protein
MHSTALHCTALHHCCTPPMQFTWTLAHTIAHAPLYHHVTAPVQHKSPAQVTSHSTAPHSTVAPHSDWLRMDPCTSTALHCTARARQHHHTHFTSTWPLDHHIICTIIIPSTHHRTPQSDSSEHLTITSPHRLQDRTSHASLTHRCSPHCFSLALTKHAKAFPAWSVSS